jgi:hypothetical protein
MRKRHISKLVPKVIYFNTEREREREREREVHMLNGSEHEIHW